MRWRGRSCWIRRGPLGGAAAGVAGVLLSRDHREFAAEYRKPNLIPFEITCVVVTDLLAAVVAPLA